MIEQSARVLTIGQGSAWVEPVSETSCSSCSSGASCSSFKVFDFFRPAVRKMCVANPLHAKPGDYVVVGMKADTLLAYSLFAYMLPLVSMILFAVAGQYLFQYLTLSGDAGAILSGLFGLLSGLKLAGWGADYMNRSEATQPVILRHKEQIIQPAMPIKPA